MYGRSQKGSIRVRALAQPVDLVELHRLAPERYPFLLQSTATNPTLGRFDILFAFPGESVELSRDSATPLPGGGFFAALDEWWRREYRPPDGAGLPFTGGWFLYLGYELAREVEPSLELPWDTLLPAAFAVRCPAAVIYDRVDDQACWVVEADAEIDRARFVADLESASRSPQRQSHQLRASDVGEDPPEAFLRSVDRAKQYIADGDVYQANLSRNWLLSVDAATSPADVYESLCAANPAPFAGLARWRDTTVISSSPERLVHARDGVVTTRPIAGTRPRSLDSNRDDTLSRELFSHPKERAEHIMLIDLERNDLGRICRPGTVEVDEMMVLESYAHVHHIVSNVRGSLREGVTPGEILRAVFPGGTITGCPKVRCMQIIAELERRARGAYTGSFGYLNRNGSLDLNILIRTMVMRGNTVSLRAGSGIVADSEPVAELEETRAKATGMLRALGA